MKKGFFGSKELTKLYSGDCFGEMALVEDKPRNATVIADEDSELFFLNRESFNEIIMSDPELKAKMEALVAARKSKNT